MILWSDEEYLKIGIYFFFNLALPEADSLEEVISAC